MPEKRIYFTTEDVERVLDAIEDQLDSEEPERALKPLHWEPMSPPPCERLHVDPLCVVVGVFFLLLGCGVLAIGLILNYTRGA